MAANYAASAAQQACVTTAYYALRLSDRSTSGITSKLTFQDSAAAHAFGLAKNHAFVDGNERIAFMSMMLFLRKNGVRFAPDPAQATKIILSLAAGEVSEERSRVLDSR